MIIPDINLLIYTYNADAPHHASAKAWWTGLMNDYRDVAIPWVVGLGFIRLMTNGRILAQPLTATEALSHVRSWLKQPQVSVLQPGPRHLDILESFAEQRLLSSTLTTDAHLAAMAIEFNAELHSNDSDFSRFPGLRCRNPLQQR